MKTKKVQKPFSVEAWKKGAKVETRSGRSVRILCTDLKDNYPIVAGVAQDDGTECSCVYDADGHFCTGSEDYCDLVIVEEVKEPERWAEDMDAIGEGWYIDGTARAHKAKFYLNDWQSFRAFATQKQAKSALAMARISQLMAHDERYGGVVTDEEWKDISWVKLILTRYDGVIDITSTLVYNFLAFHTVKQLKLFLDENERLVKDYLMLD